MQQLYTNTGWLGRPSAGPPSYVGVYGMYVFCIHFDYDDYVFGYFYYVFDLLFLLFVFTILWFWLIIRWFDYLFDLFWYGVWLLFWLFLGFLLNSPILADWLSSACQHKVHTSAEHPPDWYKRHSQHWQGQPRVILDPQIGQSIP